MAAQELCWLTYLLADLGERPRSSSIFFLDNKAMIALCKEHRLEHQTKHIALRYFLARELQQRGQLRLAYVAIRANTADIFTKALQSAQRVAPCCPAQHAPHCPTRRALLQPTCRALQPARRTLLPRASLPAAAQRIAPCSPAQRMPYCSVQRAPRSLAARALQCPARAPCLAARGARVALPHSPAPLSRLATNSAAAGVGAAGGAGGAAGSAGRVSGAGGAGPFTDYAVALGFSESAAAPGATESAAALGARESADALGASASTAIGIALAEALHTFTPDSGASRCFFGDSTTVTPLAAPVPVSRTDPTEGPIVLRASTVLPCPAVPSGSLSGLHLPTFSNNLLSNAVLLDVWVDTFIPGRHRVAICACSRTGRHLATFTRQPGSGLYTLTIASAQVAESGQVATLSWVSVSGQLAESCSCRVLSHQTLLWHHHLGHPLLPHLRSMHSRLLVFGLPRSLPSLPRSSAPPCLPYVEGRQSAAPHSSLLLYRPSTWTRGARPPSTSGPVSLPPPQPAAVDSGVETAGAEPRDAETEGEGSRGASTGGAGCGGVATGGAGCGGAASPSGGGAVGDPAGGAGGAAGARGAAGGVGGAGAASAGVVVGAGGTGGTAGGAGAASAGGAGAATTGGAPSAGGAGATCTGGAPSARGARATSAGGAGGGGGTRGTVGGAGGASAGGAARAGGAQAASTGGAAGAGGTGVATGAGGAGPAGALRYLLGHLPAPTEFIVAGTTLPFLFPPADLSQPQLLPHSPLPTAPYCYVASVPARVRCVRRPRAPAVPGTHDMTLRPSSVPQRVVLPSPPSYSLPDVADPSSDLARASSLTLTRFLATVVTDPTFLSPTASALVNELVNFAIVYSLDQLASLVSHPDPACPPSVGGEFAPGCDVLDDRQEELECLAAAALHLATMLLAPEGDLDALDIPTLRSYREAISGEYSSQWQTAMDTEMASWKSTGTYLSVTTSCHPRLFDSFLASLHEAIWLRRPLGFTGSFPEGTQWSLRQPVYGLRQAPRKWHDTLRTTLAALGFAPSTADPSLFLRTDTTLPAFYIIVYVDDLVFATSDTEALALVKAELQERHTCTDVVHWAWGSCLEDGVLCCEAEIYTGATAAQKLRWLTYLLTDLGERPCSPPVLYVDNKAMLALCREQRLEHRTKHIALRYFLVHELQQRGQLRLAYAASWANTTDVFTKALGSGNHQRFCTAFGLVPTLPHLLVA
ncbi:unnamed protein product [Closterium sp. NIES-53]